MGMSTHAYGVRDLDGRFAQMITLKLACEEAGTDYPPQVVEYFDGEHESDPEYLQQLMERVELGADCARKHSEDAGAGYEIIVANIPPEAKIIRVVNCW